MNEKTFNNITVFIVSFLLIFSVFGYGRSVYYQTKYRKAFSELGQLRNELEYKRELEEQSIRTSNIVGEATKYINRSANSLEQQLEKSESRLKIWKAIAISSSFISVISVILLIIRGE